MLIAGVCALLASARCVAPENGGDSIDAILLAGGNETSALNDTFGLLDVDALNDTQVDGVNIGIDVGSLGLDVDDIREIVANSTGVDESTAPDKTVKGFGGSFILPILELRKYDNNSAPSLFEDQSVVVFFGLNVISLANFDTRRMEYTMDVQMNMKWRDIRLRHNYSSHVLIKEMTLIERIWRPDPYFVNSKRSYFHDVTFPNFRMTIDKTGVVSYVMRLTLTPACQMVFCRFPHDEQTCDMRISSIAYSRDLVEFRWFSEDALTLNPAIKLPELRITERRLEECSVTGKISSSEEAERRQPRRLVNSSCLRLVFELARSGERMLLEKYIPSTLAMMFAWVGPYVPYDYEEVRIITPITVLLTLAQMQRGDEQIPRVSYVTSLDAWFSVMKLFTVLSLAESLAVVAFVKQSRVAEKHSQKTKSEKDAEMYAQKARRLTRWYHNIDITCRILSPVLFALWLLYYIYFVANGDQNSCMLAMEMDESPAAAAAAEAPTERLHFGLDERPPWPSLLLFGAQQLTTAAGSVVAMPLVVADVVCGGAAVAARARLVATSMLVSGLATLLQTTVGTRLPHIEGPSFSFMPPIIAYMSLDGYECPVNATDDHSWMRNMQIIQGSLMGASVVQMVIGLTGLIGILTRFVGPLTIAPLMLLLEVYAVGVCYRYTVQHWISLVLIMALITLAFILKGVKVPMPCCTKKPWQLTKQPIFELFPYLIAVCALWLLCGVLTYLDVWPSGSAARTDTRSAAIDVTPWFWLPYPGQWGGYGWNAGLLLGLVASSVASVVESVGDYYACARVCAQPPPPAHAVNRGIAVEGAGVLVGGLLGSGLGVTTFSQNTGVIGVTKVASRAVMQTAGALLVALSLSGKVSAAVASVPEPLVGAVLAVSLSVVGGVGLSALQLVDLRLSRNQAVLGFSVMFGLMLPRYIAAFPPRTDELLGSYLGYELCRSIDQMINILLSLPMFVGAAIGFILDNTFPGATRDQRGFRNIQGGGSTAQAYNFPPRVQALVDRLPGLKYFVFLPSAHNAS